MWCANKKDHHKRRGGLANALERMDHRWHDLHANGVTMIHWRPAKAVFL
jgi:hypothetical protein